MIRVEVESRFPVTARDGFDYITDPGNWLDYWPRAISVDPRTRWQRPGDRARVMLRLAGRRVTLDMTLVRIDPYRLVEYTSEQAGLPAARHRRHFDERDGELAYRIVVGYEPRPGWRGVVDRSVVRRATERAVRETLANLHERFRRSGSRGVQRSRGEQWLGAPAGRPTACEAVDTRADVSNLVTEHAARDAPEPSAD